MAVQKRKPSKKRSRQRRSANMKMTLPRTQECENCGTHVTRHTVCRSCGHYKGKEVMKVASN